LNVDDKTIHAADGASYKKNKKKQSIRIGSLAVSNVVI
jgi:hypothetical protein